MQIKNISNQAILAADCRLCRGLWSKARGLMFSRKRALIMEFPVERIVPLHNCFVFFPIDIFFVDRNRTIVEIRRRLMPFTFHTPRSKAKYVIEIPSCRKAKAGIRDRLRFEL